MTDSDPTQHSPRNEPQPANTRDVYEVKRSELPLSCPTRAMALWNSHPRVYLPIEATGRARCPYCSAEFKLID
jgi:uncharacterized Zn-finger protein